MPMSARCEQWCRARFLSREVRQHG
jgi:hypothetical protein